MVENKSYSNLLIFVKIADWGALSVSTTMEITDIQKLGVGLASFGVFFLLLGVTLLFDKGLLAIGNLFCIAGSLAAYVYQLLPIFFFRTCMRHWNRKIDSFLCSSWEIERNLLLLRRYRCGAAGLAGAGDGGGVVRVRHTFWGILPHGKLHTAYCFTDTWLNYAVY